MHISNGEKQSDTSYYERIECSTWLSVCNVTHITEGTRRTVYFFPKRLIIRENLICLTLDLLGHFLIKFTVQLQKLLTGT